MRKPQSQAKSILFLVEDIVFGILFVIIFLSCICEAIITSDHCLSPQQKYLLWNSTEKVKIDCNYIQMKSSPSVSTFIVKNINRPPSSPALFSSLSSSILPLGKSGVGIPYKVASTPLSVSAENVLFTGFNKNNEINKSLPLFVREHIPTKYNKRVSRLNAVNANGGIGKKTASPQQLPNKVDIKKYEYNYDKIGCIPSSHLSKSNSVQIKEADLSHFSTRAISDIPSPASYSYPSDSTVAGLGPAGFQSLCLPQWTQKTKRNTGRFQGRYYSTKSSNSIHANAATSGDGENRPNSSTNNHKKKTEDNTQHPIKTSLSAKAMNGDSKGDDSENDKAAQIDGSQKKESKIAALFKEYGPVAIGTYISVYIFTLTSIFLLYDNGFSPLDFGGDSGSMMAKVVNILSATEQTSRLIPLIQSNPHAANFALAWITTKFTEPVRLVVTLGIVPKIARMTKARKKTDEK